MNAITVIACSALKPELQAMSARGSLDFPLRFLDSVLHMRPDDLQVRLEEAIREARGAGSRVLLIYGDCAARTSDLLRAGDIVRVAGANCGELLLGKERHESLVKEGAFLLYREWAERWEEILLGFPGMDADLSRKMMRDTRSRFVYLDTGLRPVPHEALRSCSEYFGLPYCVVEAGLDQLETAISDAADRLSDPVPGDARIRPDPGATAVMMLDIVTTVLKRSGDIPAMALELSQKLRELTGSRMVVLVAVDGVDHGRPGHRVLVANPSRHAVFLEAEPVARIIERSLAMDHAAVLPVLGGPLSGIDLSPCLVVPLKSGEERVGAILSLGLLDAAFVDSILEIEDVLSSVVSVVLRNALLQERQQRVRLDLEREVVDRKRAEESLSRERERLAYILEGTNVGTWEWNVQTGETAFNERWAGMIGYTLAELGPTTIETWVGLAHPDDVRIVQALLERHFRRELPYLECEIRMHHKNGEWVWVLDRGKVATWTDDGKPLQMSGTHQDITARRHAEDRIRYMATHDALTGLPSLALARDRLAMALSLARRQKSLTAVMFIDLDGFKDVNDTFGHDVGDHVLREVAQRLQSCVRETDTISRVGGDEFLLLATALHSSDNAAEVARKVVHLVSEPVAVDGKQAIVGASIGIALYPGHGEDIDELIKRADEAMYRIKKSGKNGFGFAEE